jgi:serine/threonine protein kinase
MGGKAGIFEICKGPIKEKSAPLSEPIGLDKKLSGPTDDLINNPQGYKYFSESEQKFLALKHKNDLYVEVSSPNKWQTSEIIGQGSFGRVLFAANIETGELMAIKQIPIIEFSYGTAHERIKEIQEEVEILSHLNHKNIVRYLGTKRDDQYLLIFMEYVAGGTISSLLNKYGKFNETLIRVYTQQILEGLEYLHYNKIIHRDIKGANVLVGNDGVCKLADFGSAKRMIGIEDRSQFKSLKGTTNWMAPEVMRQEGHGRFADVWSLGCLVVEMATGRPPWYYKTNQIAVFMHVCTTDETPQLPPELSEPAKDFILSCFKRKPSERPNVYKLLKHPFINTLGSPTLEISIIRNEENYASNSTKFSTMEPKFKPDLSVDFSMAEGRERISIDNYEDLNPEHAVKAPFNDIITTAKFKTEIHKEENIEVYIRRFSNSSNSDSGGSGKRESEISKYSNISN